MLVTFFLGGGARDASAAGLDGPPRRGPRPAGLRGAEGGRPDRRLADAPRGVPGTPGRAGAPDADGLRLGFF